MQLGGIGETWQDFRYSTKLLFGAMLLSGVFLLAFGIIADLYKAKWLEDHAFIPNVLAGFTGFLIGVPVALVGLATVTAQREEKAASDRVQAFTRIAWNQFRDAVDDLCGEKRIRTMESIAKTIQEYHNQIFKGFDDYENGEKTPEDYQNLQVFINHQIKPWQEPFAQMMRAVGTRQDLGMSWYAVLRDWNTLDQYVRLQRLERGLPWFERNVDSLLQERMNPDAHPMNPFFEKHEGSTTEEYSWRVESMWQAFKSLYDFANVAQDHFSTRKALYSRYFPNAPVEGYLEAVKKTAMNMRQLLDAIQAIERSDWLA